MLARPAALAVLSHFFLQPIHGASYDLDIVVTREVRGAAYPVNKWNTQCSESALNATPCACFGGAARRNSVLAAAGADAVRLDLGGYASGSGLFFPSLRGQASSEFLADGGYSAVGLTYRDFSAGVNSSEPTGGAWLAQYIDRARALNPSLPPAVATNIELGNDTHLVAAEVTRANPNPPGHIAPWALVPLANNRTLAFLSMVDPQHLHPTSPHYAAKVFSYDRALQSALAGLRRLEGGPPDVIVAAISSLPLNGAPNGFADLHHRHGTSDTAEAAATELRALVQEAVGVDVFLMGLVNDLPLPPVLKNWAGDDVLVYQVAAGGSYGKRVERVHASLDSVHSRLIGASVTTESVELDCHVARDAGGEAKLARYHDVMESILGKTRGHLQRELNFDVGSAPKPHDHAWGHCARLGAEHDIETCGCRVSECPQGSFAADALRLVAGAQIGLVNGGSLRSSLPRGAVTEADIVQMLPFLNDIVRLRVSGALLRSVLVNSISLLGDASAIAAPNGRFMQVSSTLKYEWYFEDGRPTLGAVSVRPSDAADFEPLADEREYTVASSSYIAGGGDGYSMLTAVAQTPTGKTQAEITAEYLRLVGGGLPGAPMPNEGRIVQKPTVVLLHLGILCAAPSHGNVTDRLAEREACDHARHAIELVNDKTDGLYDELLPNAVIVAHESYVGCNEGLASSALGGLRAALPSMRAVIGPSCSGDVAAIAHRTSEGVADAAFISGASTMQSLSNESEYPMLARTVTADGHTAKGLHTLRELYSWKRVGVLHSDSRWATEVSQLFVDGLRAASDEAVVLNAGDTEFSLSDAQSDAFDAGRLLERLQRLDTRIVFLAAEPRAARAIFAAVYRERRLYGRGFAWLLPAVSEDMFLRDDGTVDLEAVYGAEGLLALRERADTSSDVYEAYTQRWRAASSPGACHGHSVARYCAADSDRARLSGYAPFYADSVLLYAHAMHAIFRSGEPEADALYESMRTIEPFPSVSGLLAIDEASTDRLGSLTLLNMQLSSVGGGPRADRRRLSGRAALASHGQLVEVGAYRTRTSDGSSVGLTLSTEHPVVWPGGSRTPPKDSPPEDESPALMVALIAVPLAVLVVSGVVMAWQKYRAWRALGRQKEEAERQRQHAEKHRLEADVARKTADVARMAEKMATAEAEQARRELHRFQDAVVGVRAVVSAYVPSAAHGDQPPPPPSDEPADSDATPTGGAAPRARRRLAAWYWHEDSDRIGAHNPSEVLERDGSQYVRYAWSVCRQLDDGYERFVGGSLSGPLDVDLTGAISSTGTEEKAYAKESGVRFTLDFGAMQQTNAKTGFSRRVLRVEAARRPDDPPDGYPPLSASASRAAGAAGAAHDVSRDKAASLKAVLGAATAAVRAGKAVGGARSAERHDDALDVAVVDPSAPVPADLAQGEDFLLLEPGQLIQTSQIRTDGWAHGKVVLDPVETRPASGADGVSTTAGWFPLSHTALPNPEQLEELQQKMGDNALDALRPPGHWTRVRDPMVAELHTLSDGDEKTAVVDAFMATLGGYSSLQVVGVQRVQNEAMWQSFAVKRQTILAREQDQASAARLERKWLFHGTDEDTVPKIIQQGFNRSFCGKNATAYGKGVYFARDSAYSASTTYSRPNQAREQHMFLCRVVVGEFCQGRSNALAPDVRSGHTLYDSTVDNVSNPNMYITYHDSQAFPEYLLKFKQ